MKYSPSDVCKAVDADFEPILNGTKSREHGMQTMLRGAGKILENLLKEKKLVGVIGVGGSTSTSLVCELMRPLPIGLPKVCVSTMASGDVASYVGDSDINLMPSIGKFL